MVDYLKIEVMKDKIDSWMQFFLSIIALVLSGGSASLLVLFQEHLPRPLYITLLWVLCLFIIAILLRLAFGSLIEKLYISIKVRRWKRKRLTQVKNWYTKWIEPDNLINEVIGSKKAPTKHQEARYLKLHFWFVGNRAGLIERWKHFDKNRTSQAYERDMEGVAHDVLFDHWTDPFSCFYEPLSLLELKGIMELYRWEDDEIRYTLAKLTELTHEFVQWASLE